MSKSMVKRENYIMIQGFMITDLNLKGNELLIYAIIYGFSQTDNQWFTGSRQYLADWTNSTKQGVQKCLNSLVNKGLLNKRERYENNVKFCEYQATNITGQQSLPPQSTKFTGGSQQSLPNILDDTLDEIPRGHSSEKKECPEPLQASEPTHAPQTNPSHNKKPKEPKHKYGEYQNVLLTDTEVEKLKEEYGVDMAQKAIQFLSESIAMKGYKYKSHYLAIRKWVVDAVIEREEKQARRNANNYAKNGGSKNEQTGNNTGNDEEPNNALAAYRRMQRELQREHAI